MDPLSQVRKHYEFEKSLALKLRQASKSERVKLYSSLYDELFQSMPHLKKDSNSAASIRYAKAQLKFLERYLTKDTTLLEIGPGNCALAMEASKIVSKVILIDVSKEITGDTLLPENCNLIISDGSSIPVLPETINLVFSNQLMEHLHPDDAVTQLKNILIALVPGGAYLCVTPNRLSGPYDVSRGFDETATGFHLKEYTNSELRQMFKDAGFRKTRARIGGKGYYLHIPVPFLTIIEKLLDLFPFRIRQKVSGAIPFRWLLGIKMIGFK